jgi:serine/threonine protein kinase
MPSSLRLSIGQYSSKGLKPINQDCYGALTPQEPQLRLKGIALALADGISTSDVSQIASEVAVKSFLEEYFCTTDAWSVRKSGINVLESLNAWLYNHNQRTQFKYDADKGYVCTFSGIVFKAFSAHIFHVGDSRVYHLRNGELAKLTHEHRSYASSAKSYLNRALGFEQFVDIDYHAHSIKLGDIFIMCTDGVYEHCEPHELIELLEKASNNLDDVANNIVDRAIENGSADNLTVQIIRVDKLSTEQASILQKQLDELSVPDLLQARQEFDGYTIVRELHASSRSHVYLAKDNDTKALEVIKIPSVSLRDDPAYLERFLMEEWVARRVNSAHLLKAGLQDRTRKFLYCVTEYIEGVTLTQWAIDHPSPSLEMVRNIIEQIGLGLQALHRKEILHQDIKPDNIMIDANGTVKVIDYGGVRVSGVIESQLVRPQFDLQGTALYMAPEYFIGESISTRSDQYSLAVLTYNLLAGDFPYGTKVSKATTVSAQRRLIYKSVVDEHTEIPKWVDFALQKALSPFPHKRYDEISEFIYDLKHPNPEFVKKFKAPLIDRKPILFYKGLSTLLLIIIVGLATYIRQMQ